MSISSMENQKMDDIEPRRSKRIKIENHYSQDYYVYNLEEISNSIEEVLSSLDSTFWWEVINDEIDFFFNKIYKLVDSPSSCKIIGYKWVLKKYINQLLKISNKKRIMISFILFLLFQE